MAQTHRRLFITAILAVALAVWTLNSAFAWLGYDLLAGLPRGRELRNVGSMARATTLFDAHDKPAFTLFTERRIEVPLSRMSPHLVEAILAVEDQRFFEHGGVDVIRVAGAAWKNLRDGWGTQGGSTITQQLARQSFLTPEKTVRRKLKEIVVAARLEHQLTKDDILELYLNKVYFGDGLYGVEAASLGYFGKHAADVNLAEAALLVALVKAPSLYAPTVDLEGAIERRNAVLQTMHDEGIIDTPTYETEVARRVRLNDGLRHNEPHGQYFKEEVRKLLVKQFGRERVYEGGLKVYTTVDLAMQKAAEAAVARSIQEIEGRRRAREGAALQAALVALDPHTGEVRALVGGRSFENSRFNRAIQARRQPGSAFKPFIYAAALERGYTAASIISALDTPVMTIQGAWVPEDHASSGAMTVRAALRSSSNRAAVQMLQQIGIGTAMRYAERLGLESVPSVPSLALGSGEVTLMSMTAAYAAFANGGVRPHPLLIRRVETHDGEVLYAAAPHGERAVSEATAYVMTTMMADIVDGGTGWRARRMGFNLPAAGKTGTTNDYRDAWFVGYTPHLATGVWVGYDQPRTIMGRGYAATVAVPLWGHFMAAATRKHGRDLFPKPSTVTTATICRLSGKLATSACRNAASVDDHGYVTYGSTAYTEYFVRGTEPSEYCTLHSFQPYTPYWSWTSEDPSNGAAVDADDAEPVGTTGLAPDDVPEVPASLPDLPAAPPAAAPPPPAGPPPPAVELPDAGPPPSETPPAAGAPPTTFTPPSQPRRTRRLPWSRFFGRRDPRDGRALHSKS